MSAEFVVRLHPHQSGLMLKILLQVAALVLGVLAARWLGLSWFWSVLGAFALMYVAMLALGRTGAGAVGHIGAAPIKNDDPLLLEALSEARASWPRFLNLYPSRQGNSILKFRLQAANGKIENVWGNVLELGAESAEVELVTPPIGGLSPGTASRMKVPFSDVVDWQVLMEDDTLQGGFTQVATFHIIERDTGSLPAAYAAQLARYRNASALVQPN